MDSQGKLKEHIINELTQPENEISELNKSEFNYQKMTKELYQERELYADLANALPSGIYRLRVFHGVSLIEERWSSSALAPYIIEFVNDRFYEILNLDKHIFVKNPGIINDLIYEDDKAEFCRRNVEANLLTIPFNWEGRFIVNGKLIWIHFVSVPRLLENKDIIWTGTLNDISKRKKAEQEIKLKNQELQKLNAEKDRFLSIIAHDLKSPFNSIIGFSRLLVDQIKEQDYEKTGEFAAVILQSSYRAMDLVTNLMEWAHSQSGRMMLNPQHFEMDSLINEVILSSKGIAGQKSIVIENSLPVSLRVTADIKMIGTVLRNLISNAIKFTKPGGKITILAADNQKELTVSVSDNGVGISQERIDKLFHIDESYSTPGTQNEKGTGLGLIICKEFVERNKGKIWVVSQVGAGSAFYFSLPSGN